MNRTTLFFRWLIVSVFFSYSISAQGSGTSAQTVFCPNTISKEICSSYLDALKQAAATNPDNMNEFTDALQEAVRQHTYTPEFWNAVIASPALKNTIGTLPFSTTFKFFDRENADSVLGLQFSYANDISKTIYSSEGARELSYQFSFQVDGVVTQKAEDNPRNLIDTKLSFSGSSMPSFNLKKLVAGYTPEYCDLPENMDTKECVELQISGIDKFFEPLGSVFYLDYGLNAGFEVDQELKAKNQTFGLFTLIAYEDFRDNTFLGLNNIKPAIRLALESVEPNSESPRALAGDESSYTRISGEFALVVPLNQLVGVPYSFTFSYRAYSELAPSDIVKGANLDSYQLRTYSFAIPIGLVASYSSGRLPFGIANENTVELGYKVYF